MAITKNDEITYDDLLNESLNKIKSVCCNIDEFATYVPSLLKNGESEIIDSLEVTALSKDPTRKRNNNGWQRLAHVSQITAVVEDDVLQVVSSNTVKSQFESFLASRGVKTQTNETISFKNMMAFYNNLASFLSSKLVYVTSQYVSEICIFYNQNSASCPTVNVTSGINCYIVNSQSPYTINWLSETDGGSPLIPLVGQKYIIKTQGDFFNHSYSWTGTGYLTDDDYNPTEIKLSVQDLLNAINSKNNMHYALTNLVYKSSSSSSSSSCSSCSSSSSFFIAYMDI